MFALGAKLELSTACLLVVSDVFDQGERERIGDGP